MNERLAKAEALFHDALELPSKLRDGFLQQACGEDGELLREVGALLRASGVADNWLRDDDIAAIDPPSDSSLPNKISEGPGTVIGRYKLLERIGEGGFGVVYMAEQEEPVRRKVALKVIKLGMDTRSVIARFEAERQALAMMDHPHIAKVLDAGATDTGRPYFVMELVQGIKITDYCDQNNLSTEQRLELFSQVCQAVQHAHQKGIIHRDLKPSNILVTMNDAVPHPKVIDFGVAKAVNQRLTEKTLFTNFAQMIGTPAYMSPEQAEMSKLDVDTRSDVYSLGVMLYELLTGTTPFPEDLLRRSGYVEMQRIICEEEPEKPSTRITKTRVAADVRRLKSKSEIRGPKSEEAIRPSSRRLLHQKKSALSTDLDWIVMKCLEKDRSRRYETVNGVAADLGRFLNEEPVFARPPSSFYRFQKLVRRNKLAFAAAAAIATALIIGLGFSTWLLLRERLALKIAAENASRAKEEAERAERNLYITDMNLVQQALKSSNLRRARQLLDRHKSGHGKPELRNWEWRYLWQQATSDAAFVLDPHPGLVRAVSMSVDGTWLAAAGQNGFIKVWNLLNRDDIRTLEGQSWVTSPEEPYRPHSTASGLLSHAWIAFSPKEELLATTSATGFVTLWDTKSWVPKAQLNHGRQIHCFSFSPGGKLLAVYDSNGGLGLFDLAEHKRIRTFEPNYQSRLPHHFGRVAFSSDGRWLAMGHREIHIISTADGTELVRLPRAQDQVTALAFSPNGKYLASATGYSSSSIDIWDLNNPIEKRQLTNHQAWVSSLVFSGDGAILFSGSADQTVRFWDAATWEPILVSKGNLSEVWSLTLASNGKYLISGGKDGLLAFWRTTPQEKPLALETLPGVRSSIFPDGKRLAPVGAADFSPDGRRLATVRVNGSIDLWNTTPLTAVKPPHDTGTNNFAVRYSSTGKWLAVSEKQGVIKLVDPETFKVTKRLESHRFASLPLRFLCHDTMLMSCDSRGFGALWDLTKGKQIGSWTVSSNFYCIEASPDGRLLTTGFGDGTLTFSDATTGSVIDSMFAHMQPVNGIAFSPGGELLLTGSAYGDAKLWDVRSRRQIASLEGHLLGVNQVAFSLDGKRFATSSSRGEAVKLWDLFARQEVLTLESSESHFGCLRFSPDGDTLIAVSQSGVLHLWRAPSWNHIAASDLRRSVGGSP